MMPLLEYRSSALLHACAARVGVSCWGGAGP